MWYCLFLTILQNEIQDFFISFELSTLGSERVNAAYHSVVTYNVTILLNELKI